MGQTTVIITGTRAAGKTTIAESLTSDVRLSTVEAVTTRSPRSDDRPGAYSYISTEDFESLHAGGGLAVATAYAGARYGISLRALSDVRRSGKIPLLTVTPESALRLMIDPNLFAKSTAGFFIDAPDHVLDARLAFRGGAVDPAEIRRRSEDRSHCHAPLVRIENGDAIDEAVGLVRRIVRDREESW